MSKNDYYTQAWWSLKAAVLSAARWICADCNWPNARVAHHTTYANGIICPPANLVALCHQCHLARHGLTNWVNEPYETYMARQGFRQVAEGEPYSRLEAGRYWLHKNHPAAKAA